MKRAILVGFALLVVGKDAFGQHLGELSANYSYMHYVPVGNLPSINLNGGGGAAVLYFAKFSTSSRSNRGSQGGVYGRSF